MSVAVDMERARIRSEFEQLQREYRNMEATRKAYAEESLAIIRKQREAIDKLSKDNDSIKNELDTELRYLSRKTGGTSSSGGGNGNDSNGAASNLHTQLDLYIGKVEIEHRNIESLTKQVEILRAKVVKESKVIGGINAAKEAERQLEKKVKVLDNRLEKALVRFNEVLATNRELRNVIDTLRQERSVFESVYGKLEKELADKKRAMATLIESSNQAYEARDLANMEAAKIQQEANAERVVFEQQLEAMDAAVDAEVDAAKQHEMAMRGTLTMVEEENLKKDLQETSKAVANAEAIAKAHAARVEAYEEAFNRMREETGIDDVEELVQVFLKNEDANFGLFNHVAGQTAEISRLEDMLTKLRNEAMTYDAGRKILDPTINTGGITSPRPATNSSSSTLTVVPSSPNPRSPEKASSSSGTALVYPHLSKTQNEQLSVIQTSIDKFIKKQNDARRTIEIARSNLQNLVDTIELKDVTGAELVLTDGMVTEGNLMSVLGLVEQRTIALLSAYAQLEHQQDTTVVSEANSRAVSSSSLFRRIPPSTAASSSTSLSSSSNSHHTSHTKDTVSVVGNGPTLSPERRMAISLMGTPPTVRHGTVGDKLHPILPSITDFSNADNLVSPRTDTEGDDEDDTEEGAARPLSIMDIKAQTQRMLQGSKRL